MQYKYNVVYIIPYYIGYIRLYNTEDNIMKDGACVRVTFKVHLK